MKTSVKKAHHAMVVWCIIVLCALLWRLVPGLKHLETLTIDWRYRHFNRATHCPPTVAIIDIDEQSLKLLAPFYGRWPWPRRIYKDLVEFLSLGEPKMILFDILFTEKMLHSSDDRQFAKLSQAAGNVSHAMNLLVDRAEDEAGVNPLPKSFERFSLTWNGEAPRRLGNYQFNDFIAPAQEYAIRTPYVHVVTFAEDNDGTFRRSPVLFQYQNVWLPSLALRGALSTLKEPKLKLQGQTLLVQGKGKELMIPMDDRGYLPLHFYKTDRDPPSIPMAAVIASALQLQKGEELDPSQLKVNPIEFKDKILIVGTSAVGLEDLKPTPLHPAYPGPKLQATAIANILSQDFLSIPPWGVSFLIFMILIGIQFVANRYISNPALRSVIVLGSLILFTLITCLLFQKFNLALPLACPWVLCSLGMIENLAFTTFVESYERKKLESTLSKYIAPSVVRALIAEGTDPRAEVGREVDVTVLFADIRNFTSLAETHSPQVVVARLNEYLNLMVDPIFESCGTLDKFIGDAVMAFWGAPLLNEAHALDAVRTAFLMQGAAKALRQTRQDVQFHIGIGLQSGPVVVGNIGGEKRLEYTVIGNNVNLASRIEGLTKVYCAPILIGENTFKKIQEVFLCRFIGTVQVKGKVEYTNIFEPLCEKSEVLTVRNLSLFLKAFEEALKAYQRGDFYAGLKMFERVDAGKPGGDTVSRVYAERCRDSLSTPPSKRKEVSK